MLFVIDFDGTVAPVDTVDALLEEFGHPRWRVVEQQWVEGRISSRECMAQQMALVDGDPEALEGFLHSVAIDPSFEAFLRHVRSFAEVAVVSDGIDYPIRHALRELQPPVPVYSNRVALCGRGLSITFPHFEPACAVQSGVCKCAVAAGINPGRKSPVILIGDGRSDHCLARSADFVFAKASLRRFCEAQNIAYAPFDTFDDVLSAVQGWDALEHEEKPWESNRYLTSVP